MPATSGVRVRGYRELSRAFSKADRALEGEMKAAFEDVAEPIRSDAERLAVSQIRHIGPRWGLMRTRLIRSGIYVAPRERGRHSRRQSGLRRPNLAGLLMDRAMQPALDRNEHQVAERFDDALARIERIWDRVPGG